MGFFLPKILVKKIGFLIMHYGFRIVGVFSRPFSEALSSTTNILFWYMFFHYGRLCPICFSRELGFYGSVFMFLGFVFSIDPFWKNMFLRLRGAPPTLILPMCNMK
jgi:hypothetical protein